MKKNPDLIFIYKIIIMMTVFITDLYMTVDFYPPLLIRLIRVPIYYASYMLININSWKKITKRLAYIAIMLIAWFYFLKYTNHLYQ
jgi:hypothetical protein